MDPDTVSLFDCSSTFSSRSNSLLQFKLDMAEFTMAIEKTKFNEVNSTSLVDDNPTNESEDGIVIWDESVSNQSKEIPLNVEALFSPRMTSTQPLLELILIPRPMSSPMTLHLRGSVNNSQYRLVDLKAIKLAEEACTKYVGTTFEGLAGKDGRSPLLALSVYKEIIRKHLIKNGMWDVFQF
eukprot:11571715-Ditylum_brightwellii.AAC.1